MAEDYQNEIDGLMKQISVLYEEIYDELACSQWRAFEDEKHDHTHAQTMEGCLTNYEDGVKRDSKKYASKKICCYSLTYLRWLMFFLSAIKASSTTLGLISRREITGKSVAMSKVKAPKFLILTLLPALKLLSR